jgi:hypothetical protein
VDGARDASWSRRKLDLDDDDPDGDVAVEKDDDYVGAVFGWLDLGQVGRR